MLFRGGECGGGLEQKWVLLMVCESWCDLVVDNPTFGA